MKFVVGVWVANQLFIVWVKMDLMESVRFLKMRVEKRRTAIQRKLQTEKKGTEFDRMEGGMEWNIDGHWKREKKGNKFIESLERNRSFKGRHLDLIPVRLCPCDSREAHFYKQPGLFVRPIMKN